MNPDQNPVHPFSSKISWATCLAVGVEYSPSSDSSSDEVASAAVGWLGGGAALAECCLDGAEAVCCRTAMLDSGETIAFATTPDSIPTASSSRGPSIGAGDWWPAVAPLNRPLPNFLRSQPPPPPNPHSSAQPTPPCPFRPSVM